ncbi:MAG: hypothetical protein NVS2B7_12430 [Herpetosiphon sp.]
MGENHTAGDSRPDMASNMAQWATFIAQSPLSIAIITGETHLVCCANAAFERLMQAEAGMLLDQAFGTICPACPDDIRRVLDQVLRTGEPKAIDHQQHTQLAHEETFWTYAVWPILDQHGNVNALVLQISDTTEQVLQMRDTTEQVRARRHSDQAAVNLRTENKQLVLTGLREQEQMTIATHLAMHDSLTGLPNRALLLDRLAHRLSVNPRDPISFAVLLLDVDRFKIVNDTLGHKAGDHFLQEIARRLTVCVRPQDTVARLGGDEFVLLLEEIDEVSEVMHIVGRIHDRLSEPFEIAGHSLASSASIGIVLTTSGYTQTEEILQDADTALYRAKVLGKSRSVIFDPAMHDQALALALLEAELRRAITHKEFLLHYQPIVSLQSGTIVGVEALLRWQHPTRGYLLPEAFLVAAEEAGLISLIGKWVLHTACAQMNAWHRAGLPAIYVAVNLSARQLQQPDLTTMIAKIMQQTGLAPQHLHLELTESSVMADVTVSIATLQAVTALGVQVSVDDFGTGYSSLSYLKLLPLTTVKIDRSFVHKVASNPDDAAITAAIIAMAHQLKLEVIAEGVETAEQLAALHAKGCDAIQGYLVSEPLSAVAMTEQLSHAIPSPQSTGRAMLPTVPWFAYRPSDPLPTSGSALTSTDSMFPTLEAGVAKKRPRLRLPD